MRRERSVDDLEAGVDRAINALRLRTDRHPSYNFNSTRLNLLQGIRTALTIEANPNFHQVGHREAIRQLAVAERLARDLRSHLSAMHDQAWFQMERRLPKSISTKHPDGAIDDEFMLGALLVGFKPILLEMLDELSHAAEEAAKQPPDEQRRELIIAGGAEHVLVARSGGKVRAPVNIAARMVAQAGCAAFEAFTGRRATITTASATSNVRTGPFVSFVSELFLAARIDANAANYAKQVAEIRRKIFGCS